MPAPAVAHRLLSPPLLMPSLHIIGEKDYIRQVHTPISASAEDVPTKISLHVSEEYCTEHQRIEEMASMSRLYLQAYP